MKIRRLERGDEPRLQELCRRFKERLPSDEEAARLLARDDVHIWVAEVDSELAGFTYAYVLLRIDGDTSVFLYELDVDERYRRQRDRTRTRRRGAEARGAKAC